MGSSAKSGREDVEINPGETDWGKGRQSRHFDNERKDEEQIATASHSPAAIIRPRCDISILFRAISARDYSFVLFFTIIVNSSLCAIIWVIWISLVSYTLLRILCSPHFFTSYTFTVSNSIICLGSVLGVNDSRFWDYGCTKRCPKWTVTRQSCWTHSHYMEVASSFFYTRGKRELQFGWLISLIISPPPSRSKLPQGWAQNELFSTTISPQMQNSPNPIIKTPDLSNSNILPSFIYISSQHSLSPYTSRSKGIAGSASVLDKRGRVTLAKVL